MNMQNLEQILGEATPKDTNRIGMYRRGYYTETHETKDDLAEVRNSVGMQHKSYTPFKELLRLVERERTLQAWGFPHVTGRLCGGGESSLNGGGAWGSPPGAGSGSVGAGVSGWNAAAVGSSQQTPQQQQTWNSAQAGMPPPVGPPGSGPRQAQDLLGKSAVGGSVTGSGQAGAGWNQVANPGKQSSSQQQPAPQQPGGSNQQNPGPNANQPPTGSGSQQAPGAQGGVSAGGAASAVASAGGAGAAISGLSVTPSAKLEHLNSMREALFAQDGWGCQHVNQDTQWDVPVSPEPATKPDPSLKATVNNGTELWETNLRNGGQPPVQAPSQKTPWGPQSHHGGTWGVDDEANGEGGNVWTGAPGGPGAGGVVAGAGPPPVGPNAAALVGAQAGAPGGWQQGGGGAGAAGGGAGGPVGAGGMWQTGGGLAGAAGLGAQKKDNDWNGTAGVGLGATGGGSGGGWGDQRGGIGVGAIGGTGPNAGVPPHLAALADGLPNVDIRNMRPPGAGGLDQSREFRGDPRGISGRLSGSTSGMLDHYPMGKMPPPGGMSSGAASVAGVGGSAGNQQWPLGGGGLAGAGQSGGGTPSNMPPTKSGGWDDNSPPAVRRNPNIDDGTALWAAAGPGGNGGRGTGAVSDGQMVGRGGRNGPLGGINSGPIGGGPGGPGLGGGPRMVGSGPPGNPLKNDGGGGGAGGMWHGGGGLGAARNGSWDDPTLGGAGGSNWDEKATGGPPGGPLGGGASWMDGGGPPGSGIPGGAGGSGGNSSWNANKKPLGGGGAGWPDSSSGAELMGNDWNIGGPAGGKMATKPPHGGLGSGPLEIIRGSKQYRILCEMGYKKEDVEFALRASNMALEEAVELLQRNGSLPNVVGLGGGSAGGIGDWRRDDGHVQLGGGGSGTGGNAGGGGGAGGNMFEPPFPGGGRYMGGGAGGGGAGGGAGAGGHSLHFQQGNQNGMAGNGAGNMGGNGGNPNLSGLHGLSAKSLGSYLNQAPPPMGGAGGQGGSMVAFNQSGGAGGNPIGGGAGGVGGQNSVQPNTQLRSLVQQIQMAVQTGYLNPQILNQPLAPQTFLLLNQLLTSIKQLQVTQGNLQRGGGGAGPNNHIAMISKIKQQIAGLQNQIATQQTLYVKQQQQQQQQQQQHPHQQQQHQQHQQQQHQQSHHQHSSGGGNPSSHLGGGHLGGNFHRNDPNELTALQNSLSEMTLGKDHNGPYHSGPPGSGGGASGGNGGAGSSSQQSRLNQWKLPSMMKDSSNHDLTDFSRAPGSTAKPVGLGGNGAGLGGLQSESTWSSGGAMADGWPDNANTDITGKDWPCNQDSFSDLVPEFEPGKPWKGTQMKIEEDPTITPGSIARSPIASISVGSAKDSELFATSSKPSPTDSISLTSSTWSFSATGNNFSSSSASGGMNKLGGPAKNTWSDSGVAGAASDVWGAGSGSVAANKTPCGPPPGLSSGKATGGAGPGSNGWVQRPGHGPGNNWSGGASAGAWYSTWLLLKNLTAQIDGSTLRTLCMQHGPLQNFHLYLNHGIALCKYLTREEASKAQLALNNCVLGNTTICAESPTDSEVQTILQHLGLPGQNGGGSVGGGAGGNAGTTGSAGVGNTNMAQTWRSSGPNIGRVSDTWGSSWSSSGGGSNLWTPLDGPTERGTPSNLNSFLPENLLIGELN